MEQPPEYAPQYSMRERWKYAITGVLCAAVVVGFAEWWALPQWRLFAETAHCRTVLGISGIVWVFYTMFVGMPLAAGLSTGAMVVPIALRTIRTKRHPPPGRKVMGKVRIQTGGRAVLSGVIELLMVAAIFALAIWGYFQAAEYVAQAKPADMKTCDNTQPATNEPRDASEVLLVGRVGHERSGGKSTRAPVARARASFSNY